MKKVKELAKLLNSALLGQSTERTDGILRRINQELDAATHRVTGVSAAAVADEDMEDTSLVRLFWQVRSELMAKVLIEAAQQQTYYKELDK